MINAVGYAVQHSFSRLTRFVFQRANATGERNDCEGANGSLATYGGPMVPKAMAPSGGNLYGKDNTFGGCANVLVVREDFVLKMPAGLRPEEILDFCVHHRIDPDVQVLPVDQVNDADDKVDKGGVRFRDVIETAALQAGLGR